jgi:hypothetical protein
VLKRMKSGGLHYVPRVVVAGGDLGYGHDLSWQQAPDQQFAWRWMMMLLALRLEEAVMPDVRISA